jgi:hypothetical protein
MRRIVDILNRLSIAALTAIGLLFGAACVGLLVENEPAKSVGAVAALVTMTLALFFGGGRSAPSDASVTARLPDTDEARDAMADLNRAIARINALASIRAVRPNRGKAEPS